MRYISTNNPNVRVSLSEAVNRCVAADGGLFIPETLPYIPRAFFNNISEMSLRDIAYVVATTFFGDEIDSVKLKNIVDESFAFEAPFIKIKENTYVLELFHGPTLTFKDYGARFMARLMKHLAKSADIKRTVLVATTGNTGAAAANGFYKLSGINVVVLYPKGKLSHTQIAQLTSLGSNIYPVEVIGSIEDCKHLVEKSIFNPSFAEYGITGANSINVGRLIPQISFSLYAYSRLVNLGIKNAENAYYIMPAGNMSNVVAAIMAKLSGCPINKIVAATGANDQISKALNNSFVNNNRPVSTLATSIDMAYPSGLPRIFHLFKDRNNKLSEVLECAQSVSDEKIIKTIQELHNKQGYDIDTHGAVAYAAAMQYADEKVPKVIFATGHPAKQHDLLKRITGIEVEQPSQFACYKMLKRNPVAIAPTLPALKKYFSTIK